ncbi:DUF1801 domain-containing protein [Litoribacter alkaliphilus]|uniref:DUF1801 domain-containing protein n=1 Tax=Litoribacter ruber TaxID=702568 RepID=A0AAP2G290_9BACT|nr:DUF1801 domain-containing protein [Litoribacter alkaliphilus]MBS9525412.1 DUF1801 domain-containing protein [Litoribacter alkaliphilus]
MEEQPQSVKEYIFSFPKKVQLMLELVRAVIRRAAPEAEESISYGMPTYKLNGNLVHFAAFKHHIGFYPVPKGMEEFEDELKAYKTGKGSIQFPLDKPLPLDLISRIVKHRAEENRKMKK